MERKSNNEIIKFRSYLRNRYDKWHKSKKSGFEHLSQDPQHDELTALKTSLQEEADNVDTIISCCEELRENIIKDWRKL